MLGSVIDGILSVVKSLSVRVVLLVILTNVAIIISLYTYTKPEIDKLKISANLDKAQIIVDLKKDLDENRKLLQEVSSQNKVLDGQLKIILTLMERK